MAGFTKLLAESKEWISKPYELSYVNWSMPDL